MRLEYGKSLSELSEIDIKDFGKKAVNLGIMMRARIKVPEGFCISQDIYEKIIDSHGKVTFPERFLKELMTIFKTFNGEPLVVRSSSSLEDSESNSIL